MPVNKKKLQHIFKDLQKKKRSAEQPNSESQIWIVIPSDTL